MLAAKRVRGLAPLATGILGAITSRTGNRATTLSKFADELITSMKQAAAHASGRRVRDSDVKTIRKAPHMSQRKRAGNLAEFFAASPLRGSRMKTRRVTDRLQKLEL